MVGYNNDGEINENDVIADDDEFNDNVVKVTMIMVMSMNMMVMSV